MLKKLLNELKRKDHQRYLGGLDFFKYIGPGLLVTVGFIDPGNWASNFAAGSDFGYTLLWVVTLSTVMLIVLQHNVAHLGIVTGLCLSEAAHRYAPRWIARPILGSAVLASISTSLAEILGGAIALQMLVGMPIVWGRVAHYGAGGGVAFHQLIPAHRTWHHRFCVGHRAFFPLRAVSGGHRLASCRPFVGGAQHPSGQPAYHHERAGSGGDAS